MCLVLRPRISPHYYLGRRRRPLPVVVEVGSTTHWDPRTVVHRNPLPLFPRPARGPLVDGPPHCSPGPSVRVSRIVRRARNPAAIEFRPSGSIRRGSSPAHRLSKSSPRSRPPTAAWTRSPPVWHSLARALAPGRRRRPSPGHHPSPPKSTQTGHRRVSRSPLRLITHRNPPAFLLGPSRPTHMGLSPFDIQSPWNFACPSSIGPGRGSLFLA